MQSPTYNMIEWQPEARGGDAGKAAVQDFSCMWVSASSAWKELRTKGAEAT